MSFLTALLASIALYVTMITIILFIAIGRTAKEHIKSKAAKKNHTKSSYYEEDEDDQYAMYVDETGRLHKTYAHPL